MYFLLCFRGKLLPFWGTKEMRSTTVPLSKIPGAYGWPEEGPLRQAREHSPQSPAEDTSEMPFRPVSSDSQSLPCTPTPASSQEVGAEI